MKVLRVFFTFHELGDSNGSRYSKTKMVRDFPSLSHPDKAYEELYREFGQLDLEKSNAPARYAVIQGHKEVEDVVERGVIESEKTYEVPLFSGKVLNDCLMDSPNIGLKRRKRK